MVDKRGFFEIGIINFKTDENMGILWRTAYQLGASGIFTIGRRYEKQSTDVYKAYREIPLRHYHDFDTFFSSIPYGSQLIGVEIGGRYIPTFHHPPNAVYLLGSEASGIPPKILEKCHDIISLPSVRTPSFNVAIAGAMVMYDRLNKISLSN